VTRTIWSDQNYFARRFKAYFSLTATAHRSRFTHNSVEMKGLSHRDG
jgi:AraC family L-rhamnose operon transcriptional activator RhaR